MWASSPIALVDQVKAPVLLALGKKDRRVPFSQGLEYYHALRARGELFYFVSSILFTSMRNHVFVLCLSRAWTLSKRLFGSLSKYTDECRLARKY